MKCPFTGFKKDCPPKEGCPLWTEETRRDDRTGDVNVIRGCALVIGNDHTRMMHQRIAMLQVEMGVTKQAAIFHGVAALCEDSRAKEELLKLIKRHIPDVERLTQ